MHAMDRDEEGLAGRRRRAPRRGAAVEAEPEAETEAETETETSELVEALDRAVSRGGRPGAAIVIDHETVKVVAFEFAAGDVLAEHAAHHPVLIQILRGRVRFGLPDGEVELRPGRILRLAPRLRHAVTALEPSTLTVTMLLPHD